MNFRTDLRRPLTHRTPAGRRFVFTHSSARWQVRGLVALLAVAAIAGAVVLKPSGDVKPDAWSNFRQSIARRAQVDLFEDFSAGLDAWESGGGGASGWSYDNNGFVNPGALSLSQSLPLTNYDLDALVQIEAKGVGLAFRASGARDYQAARLLIKSSDRMPALVLERYAVLAGKASPRTRVHYPPDTSRTRLTGFTCMCRETPSRCMSRENWWITGPTHGLDRAAPVCSA